MRRAWLLGATVAASLARDASHVVDGPAGGVATTACEGNRAPLPPSLFYELRAGAFPGSGRPDVAVHVPPGFDATRRPGVVMYFHGWDGCVAAALAEEDTACSEGGEPRPGSRLAAQMDEARVNALLVAVELRADAPTGEPGQLALADDARELLRELFAEHLAAPLGCTLELDDVDRIVLVAHSGGYQAAASVLAYGGLSRLTEVILLDALYGADDVFSSWLTDPTPGPGDPRRFVDLYTCCGLPFERSHAMARVLGATSAVPVNVNDDEDVATLPPALTHPVVFALVAPPHEQVPRSYFRTIIESAGFQRIRTAGE
jgi:pimeloyl-ACP methyl ester carboxylesterase